MPVNVRENSGYLFEELNYPGFEETIEDFYTLRR